MPTLPLRELSFVKLVTGGGRALIYHLCSSAICDSEQTSCGAVVPTPCSLPFPFSPCPQADFAATEFRPRYAHRCGGPIPSARWAVHSLRRSSRAIHPDDQPAAGEAPIAQLSLTWSTDPPGAQRGGTIPESCTTPTAADSALVPAKHHLSAIVTATLLSPASILYLLFVLPSAVHRGPES
ncbi:hypothetical protein CC78DRAFT_573269 [Lojkania enalia]|uniref:Uncharacterized protein n=1 Tax=Lojkania enalia TaxID=147567 RepID=A0A9P4TRY5_9PLEO|nr:hypothetical protein CC78DRAFT_573269 [Didymosphaeria enalia]